MVYLVCLDATLIVSGSRQPMLNSPRADADEQMESRKKAAKMLFAIVLMFAICFFPIHLLNILR